MKQRNIFNRTLSAICCAAMLFALSGTAFAMSRAEIAKISVNKEGTNFKYWNENAKAFQTLKAYVKDVTDPASKNFIPVCDRIAVFDLDGTLMCETTPCYFEWMLYLQRALYDKNYTPKVADREYAKIVEAAIKAGHLPEDMEGKEAKSQASVFSGMTLAEYDKYVKKFMETPAEGLKNLKRGESFYLPMVEVVSYLRANDFTVYIVSGSDRQALRLLVDGIMDIKKNNIIGTDISVYASGQGDKDALEYKFATNKDDIIRGQFVLKDVKMNKVVNISREIGMRPVLSFGNSSGDASMHNFTIDKRNKYKALAFALCCDDIVRELGNIKKADKMRESCAKEGWIPISMRNDWKTIYGDGVEKIK